MVLNFKETKSCGWKLAGLNINPMSSPSPVLLNFEFRILSTGFDFEEKNCLVFKKKLKQYEMFQGGNAQKVRSPVLKLKKK